MTDLTKAIAEVKRVTPPNSPWEAGDIGVGSSPVDYHIAAILNAVASGEMTPATERDAAVAAALEKAANLRFVGCVGSAGFMPHVKQAILALINQPQADALARVRAEAVKVKPLVWFEVEKSRYGGKYTADGYTIRYIEGLWLLDFAGQSKAIWRFPSLDEAKSAAQADHDARIRAAIGGVE